MACISTRQNHSGRRSVAGENVNAEMNVSGWVGSFDIMRGKGDATP